ncbi:TPA: hypothetical protein ACHORB_002349, partial [Escherichia coli]
NPHNPHCFVYIRKIAFRRGIEIPAIHYLWNYPPRQIFIPAKLKNALRWWAFPPLVEKWHHINQLDNG